MVISMTKDMESEAQRGHVTCPGSQSPSEAEPRYERFLQETVE